MKPFEFLYPRQSAIERSYATGSHSRRDAYGRDESWYLRYVCVIKAP